MTDPKWIGCHSNNFWVGREGQKVSLLVLHWMAGNLDSCDKTFQDGRRQASAHYGIGQTEVHQYVKESDTAYHAGVWDINTQSIGIEHEGGPDLPITEAVYKQSCELVADLCKRYGIPCDSDHIKRHRDYKATQCPGTLDVERIIRDAGVLLTKPQEITDQTKINIGGEFGVLEVQAIRSKLNDIVRDYKTAIDERLKTSKILEGFVQKWVQEYKLPVDAGLVQVEGEMAKLIPLEDLHNQYVETIERVVGTFHTDSGRLGALEAVRNEINTIAGRLEDCQKKLTTRKILKTFTFLGYTFKVYKEGVS
jgi:hypothetical protein